jgi:hypothetical protein
MVVHYFATSAICKLPSGQTDLSYKPGLGEGASYPTEEQTQQKQPDSSKVNSIHHKNNELSKRTIVMVVTRLYTRNTFKSELSNKYHSK